MLNAPGSSISKRGWTWTVAFEILIDNLGLPFPLSWCGYLIRGRVYFLPATWKHENNYIDVNVWKLAQCDNISEWILCNLIFNKRTVDGQKTFKFEKDRVSSCFPHSDVFEECIFSMNLKIKLLLIQVWI